MPAIFVPVKLTIAFPNGATLPMGVAVSVPLTISVTDAAPLKFERVIAVVV